MFYQGTNKCLIRGLFLALLGCLCACSPKEPEGKFQGVVKDWIYEVFEGHFVEKSKEWTFELILSQSPDLMKAEVTLKDTDGTTMNRVGKWKIGDGERVIEFDDGSSPREFFLIKRGVRYAYQTTDGLFNDDGSPLLLVRNEGRSIKGSYPIEFIFGENGGVLVSRSGVDGVRSGSWKHAGERILVSIKLPVTQDANGKTLPEENYKYFLSWADQKSTSLILEKIVVMRPFLKEDGSKRQSWMSSLVFSECPVLEQK